MTDQQITRALQCLPALGAQWAPHLRAAIARYTIDSNPARAAMFLAQVGHESQSLAVLSENLNYSAEALLKKFGRHRITAEQCELYGRTTMHPADREAIANTIYGGEWGRQNLGNTQPGDGYKFRGQGPIQITGRANAAALRDRLRVIHGNRVPDFEQIPEQLCTPEWGAWSAADFWHSRNINRAADSGNVGAVTRAINGGLNGLDDRKARYAYALEVLS